MRTTTGIRARVGLQLAGSALAVLTASQSVPACVVGTGSGASCTEAALNACLPGGGSFDGGVTFACGGTATLVLTSTKTLSASTTVDGGGAITLQNSGSSTFKVNSGVDLVVENLTLSGTGVAIDSVGGSVTATNCTFTGNSSGISAGGPIVVTGCTFTGTGDGISTGGMISATNCTFTGNGDGISAGDAVTVTGCTFTNNNDGISAGGLVTASGCTFTGNDDGISSGSATVTDSAFVDNNDGISSGPVTATRCTFAGNVDGISASTVTATNSTFANNTNLGVSTGTLTATNCTFANNTSSAFAGTATLTNTILASSGSGNCSGTVTDGGHNIDDGTTCGFTGTGCANTSGTSFCNTSPDLDPAGLTDHGGPTQTIAPLATSPAIGHGDSDACSAPPVGNVDQRGLPRSDPPGGPCDIGAFEVQGTTTTTSTTTTTTLPGSCPAIPTAGCRAPAVAKKGLLLLRRGRKSVANLLRWRWQFGAATTLAEFGDPLTATRYELCVYDPTGLKLALPVAPGGTCGRQRCWSGGTKSFRYRNRTTQTNPITDVILRAGAVRKATVSFAARGSSLAVPSLPFTLPATVELHATTGVCWSTIHSSAELRTSKLLRSRSD